MKIAFAGPKGGGKSWVITEVGKKLENNLQAIKLKKDSPVVSMMAFADPIYDAQLALFGATINAAISGKMYNEYIKDKGLDNTIDPMIGMSPRGFRQQFGTEFARAKNPDIWVNIIEEKLRLLEKGAPDAPQFITDMRFPNELELLQSKGFEVYYVNSMGRPNVDSHESEKHNLTMKAVANMVSENKPQAWMMVDDIAQRLFDYYSENFTASGIIELNRKIK